MNTVVEPLADRYELIGDLLGTHPDELRLRDSTLPSDRWLAFVDDRVVATARAWLRPDDRRFLTLAGGHSATDDLIRAVRRDGSPLYAHASASQTRLLAALRTAGFEVENQIEHFRVRFERALRWLHPIGAPRGYRLVDVRETDPARLFELDTELRQDVPGTDGWRGDRGLFNEELGDPAAYIVALRENDYAGLCRIWRNEEPSFGLLALRRPYRGGFLAAWLLKRCLTEAAAWGYDHFATGTSTSNGVVHPRLIRLAEDRLGYSYQMVLRDSTPADRA